MFEIAAIIAVIVALSEVIKRLDVIPAKYMPLVSLAFGIIAGLFFVDASIQEKVMMGLMMGLSAAGLFDQSKIVTKKGDDK